jgi:hypothetical protein
MHLATHLLISWLGANAGGLERRDRALATLAGVLPDADAIGIVRDVIAPVKDMPYYWYGRYHHVLCHNIFAGIAATVICYLLARQKWKTAAIALILFHIHLLADLLGSGGTPGNIWPVYYLYPIYPTLEIYWKGQWALNAWPNVAITAVALALTLYLGAKRGHTPVEMLSTKADHELVGTIRIWIRR